MNIEQKLNILNEYCQRQNSELCHDDMCKLSNMNCCFWTCTDEEIYNNYEIIKDDEVIKVYLDIDNIV